MHTTAIRLTSKRQATLPKALCDEMHLQPGDTLTVNARTIDGEKVWLLKPVRREIPSWFGILNKYAKGKKHDMDSIRAGVEKARKKAFKEGRDLT